LTDAPLILIVDDDPATARMLARALGRHGYRTESFTSADAALSRASVPPAFDAALLDLVMPGRDGASLASDLRQHLPGLPVALLTGYTRSPLLSLAQRSSAAVFTKPVVIQEIVDFLRSEIP
jgi:CheY-like chemotaxis protein